MSFDFSKGPLIMGIVNVTPDSFSDGGAFIHPQAAIDHALKLIDEGADILDIGGESTRPGAQGISTDEEQDRILPVIEGLRSCGKRISVDTRHAATMRAAVAAGAGMINDVSALRGTGALEAAAELRVPVCLMHMQGMPGTMQDAPQYEDVVSEILVFLADRIKIALAAGIEAGNMIVDPGIGFGKALHHNVDILNNLYKFQKLGVPVLLGTSRKSFIEKIHEGARTDQRLGGSIASVLCGYLQGVQIFRVHDVYETVQALRVFEVIHMPDLNNRNTVV